MFSLRYAKPFKTSPMDLHAQVAIMRKELKNIREQIFGLRQKHLKDVASMKKRLESGFSEQKSEITDDEENRFTFRSLGNVVDSSYSVKNGIPRQSGICAESTAKIKLDIENAEHALDGLQEFSHIWLIFAFDENPHSKSKVAPPRLKGLRVGVLASRSPHRPNPIGLSLVKLDGVDASNGSIFISGHDLLLGTRIVDIKPYVENYDKVKDASCVRKPDWIANPEDDLDVGFTSRALKQLTSIFDEDSERLKSAIESVLRADPRSVYRKDKCGDRLYYFTVDNKAHCTVWFDEDFAQVVKVAKVASE